MALPEGATTASVSAENAGIDALKAPDEPEVRSLVRRSPSRRPKRILRTLGLIWVGLLLAGALFAPVLPIPDPNAGGLGVAERPFGNYLLGTDQLGRDMFARILFGARTSLVIAGAAVGLAVVVGVPLGLAAGYFRGRIDTAVVAIGDIVLAFPGLVFVMVIAALAGPSITNLVLAIALFQLPMFVRLTRANTLSFTQREFVSAARGLGARDSRVAVRHVLPNVIPAVRAYAMAAIGIVLVVEGSLSFLGLGIRPPTPAWGSMIAAGRPQLAGTPHLVLVPAIMLFMTVLAFNGLSEGPHRSGERPTRLSA